MSFRLRAARARSTALACGIALASALGSAAQTPDVAAGTGLIRGRVVQEDGSALAAPVPVLLYALSESGEPGLREAQTNAAGEFSFAGVANDPGTIYLVGTKLGEVPFGTRATFAQGQSELVVELRVARMRNDPAAAQVGAASVQLDWGCSGLRVSETLELRNPTSDVLLVPESSRKDGTPLARLALPEGAAGFHGAMGSFEQGLEFASGEVRFFGPLHPGSRSLEFFYDVPARERVAFERRFERGAERVTALVHGGGSSSLEPGPEFRAGGEIARGDARYAAASTGRIAAGASLRFELPAPAKPDASARLTLEAAELWLELDDATLRADEGYALQVSGGEALAGGGAPLFCLELPDGASDLRFSNETLSFGLALDANGALALRGPLPAGRSELRIRYQLPTRGNPMRYARSFPLALPLARVLVADTGVVAETQRLHRLQPVAVDGRNYAHLEGLSFEPREEIAVDLRRIQLGGGLSRGASLAFASAGGLLALAYLSAPLRRGGRASPAAAGDDDATGIAREREALFASIADLDHDFETGKVSAEDHARMRDELRARAIALLAAERAARPAADPAPSPAASARRACAACGAPSSAGARFCSACGARLDAASTSPRAGGA
jgi:hypothetical protein